MDLLQTTQRILAPLGFHGDINSFLIVFGLAVARLAAATTLVPFFGGQAVSPRIRFGLAVILAATISPYLTDKPEVGPMNAVLFVALLVKEVLIGSAIGIVAQFLFFAVQAAGTLIDTQRGMNQPAYFSPQLPGNVSALGNLKLQTAIVLFLAVNGHLMFLRAMHASFDRLPVLAFPKFPPGGLAFVDQMARISGGTIVIGLQLAAPVLLALFLVDASFGLIGKVAERMHVHQESQPVKALFGLAVFFLAVGFLMNRLIGLFGGLLGQISEFIRTL